MHPVNCDVEAPQSRARRIPRGTVLSLGEVCVEVVTTLSHSVTATYVWRDRVGARADCSSQCRRSIRIPIVFGKCLSERVRVGSGDRRELVNDREYCSTLPRFNLHVRSDW